MTTLHEIAARIVYDMPASDYHDNCGDAVTPLFSASIAKLIVGASPLHAHHAHPLLGAGRGKRSAAMDEGTILDSLLTGESDRVVVTNDFADFRKDAAKEWRDAALAAGKLPLVADKFAPYANAAERIRRRLADEGAKLDDCYQATVLFSVRASNGNAVKCKARFDHFQRADLVVTDLKKIEDARPGRNMARHVYRYGYDIQGALYTIAAEKLDARNMGRVRFDLAFFEAAQPHGVTIAEFAGTMKAVGNSRLQLAIDTWEECLRTDTWPGYVGRHRIEATNDMLEDMRIQEVDG
jgi:hypothetical protein